MKTFAMSGDLGDVIFSLRVCKELNDKDSIYYLVDRPTITKSWSPARLASLIPLMEAQPYIGKVIYGEPKKKPTHDFTDFRSGGLPFKKNLSNIHADWVNVKLGPYTPWLEPSEILPEFSDKVVIHRSPRYHNQFFPWKQLIEKYKDNVVAVGLPNEHAEFEKEVGAKVELIPTKDYLVCANILASCALFIGNQSSPHAIAMGLGTPVLQETCARVPDCVFEGANAYYAAANMAAIDGDIIGKADDYLLPEDVVPPGGGWRYRGFVSQNLDDLVTTVVNGNKLLTHNQARLSIRKETTDYVVRNVKNYKMDKKDDVAYFLSTINQPYGVKSRLTKKNQ